ncbi:MAG: hypothetical protein Aureis2KO_21690 [Aureisphaera sp.]
MECKNCSSVLNSTHNYCEKCGAKVIRNRLTIKNIWEDFQEQFLNYDNRFLKTYLSMFRKPHEVIGSYINGTRKKYVNVLSYYAIALTFTGIQLFVIRKFYPESMDLNFVPTTQPQEVANIDWAFDYYSFLALINLPLYALLAKLTYTGLKKFNYTEHLVVMSYAAAQFAITNFIILTASVALGGNYFIVGNAMNLLLMIYVGYIYKKLYPLSLGKIILRTLLFFGVLLGLMIVAGIIQFAYLYFSGGLEEMIQAEKEKRGVSYIVSSIINWTS